MVLGNWCVLEKAWGYGQWSEALLDDCCDTLETLSSGVCVVVVLPPQPHRLPSQLSSSFYGIVLCCIATTKPWCSGLDFRIQPIILGSTCSCLTLFAFLGLWKCGSPLVGPTSLLFSLCFTASCLGGVAVSLSHIRD